MSERRSVLLLCDESPRHAANVLQHIAALKEYSRHDVRTFNPIAHAPACAQLELPEFDVVVIHYTLMITAERYLPEVLARKIAAFDGLTVQFVQDEYRAVDKLTAKIANLGIDVLFTCVPSPEREQLYGERLPNTTLITTLPGLVPEELVGRKVPRLDERVLDVGYRGRRVPVWLGRLGQEKLEIGRGFLERAKAYGLRCDISSAEEDRLYGERWYRFLCDCRATLGTESGASVVDLDGSVERSVNAYLARHPQAEFEEVEREVLAPHEGRLTIHVASSRLFEAAALRTAMILFPGDYSGVVEPETHYLPLAKDFSNIGDTAEALRDRELLERMTSRAYDDLIASRQYSLWTFVEEVDNLIDERSEARAPAAKRRYRQARLRRTIPTLGNLTRLRTFGGNLLMPPAAGLLVCRDHAVRRLALAGTLDQRLAGDLWRLAALRRSAGRVFHLRPSLEKGGRRLVLTSQAEPANESEPHFRVAEIEEIVWNHSEVGSNVALFGNGFLNVPVGASVPGSHRFEALVRLAKGSPELVERALQPLLRRP